MGSFTANELLDVTIGSVQELWISVLAFLPALIGAVIIFVVGLIVAAVLAHIVERIVYYLKIDTLLRNADVEPYFQRANIRLDAGHFFGRFIYWFVVIAFLLAASDILHFTAFSNFLGGVLGFIPDVIIAALILLAAMVVANFLQKLVEAAIAGAKMHYAHGIGLIAWWVVFIFGLVAALTQVGVNVSIINTLITGLIAMLALAGGLAFGLGGKEHAHRFLGKVSSHLRK